jgi:hypothetical protein
MEFGQIKIPVPSTGTEWTVDLTNASPALIQHLVFHALKQKLGDAAAGAANAVAEGLYADKRTAAIELVTKRMDTILNVPTSGEARSSLTPLEKALVQIVREMQTGKKVPGKERATNPDAARTWVQTIAGERFDAVWEKVQTGAETMVAAKPTIEI